jgi:uncharacterized FlaG/YvyC family protein
MQITMVTHPLPTATTAENEISVKDVARPLASEASTAASAADAEVPNLWDNAVLRELREAAREKDPTLPAFARAELTLDMATGRIVVRIVEFDSEKIVREYSPEQSLQLLARVRERLGPLLSAQV